MKESKSEMNVANREEVQVFNMDSDSELSIDCSSHGVKLVGPALVIVIKKEDQ